MRNTSQRWRLLPPGGNPVEPSVNHFQRENKARGKLRGSGWEERPGRRLRAGVGGGQLRAPEAARGARPAGEREGGKWPPSGRSLGAWGGAESPGPAPRHYRWAVRPRGAPTGSRRLPRAARVSAAAAPLLLARARCRPSTALPGPAMPESAPGLPGGRKRAAETAAAPSASARRWRERRRGASTLSLSSRVGGSAELALPGKKLLLAQLSPFLGGGCTMLKGPSPKPQQCQF